jgi:hypothetical protein
MRLPGGDWTSESRAPIWHSAMTRLLLTLLALLTGLAAQVSPAQARVAAASGAEMSVQLPDSAAIAAAASKLASRPEAASGGHLRTGQFITPQQAFRAATVQIGIDRARE